MSKNKIHSTVPAAVIGESVAVVFKNRVLASAVYSLSAVIPVLAPDVVGAKLIETVALVLNAVVLLALSIIPSESETISVPPVVVPILNPRSMDAVMVG